jgi:DNA anti-recombination protein RmuC
MSRAYRIKVRESLRRVIRAKDHVSTQLELLEILPAEQMADLLTRELEGRGFKRTDKELSRKAGGVTVTIDPKTGTVTVQAEVSQEVSLESEKEGWSYGEFGGGSKQTKKALQEEARKDLAKKAEQKVAQLQGEATDRLERLLHDLRRELDKAVNRVTAEALKQKAAQLGQIKELTEDPQTGSLTIVLEV